MAGTQNGWNNQINGSYNQIILNAGTNGVAISTDASAATVNVGTGGAVKTTTLGSTNSTSATTVQSGSGALNVTSANGALTINSGTGALSISNDASATTVTIATGGAVKTTTLGSTNSTSATTVQSGSGALNVTSTNGALTINSGTGALGISTDASATTVSLATGAAVKTVTLGSTNTTSSTAIKSGSGNVVVNSGLTVDSSGRMTNGAQPAFFAYLTTSPTNVTGDGTNYTVVFDTTSFNQGSCYNTGTGVFTAPISGIYYFHYNVFLGNIGAGHTLALDLFNTSAAIFTPNNFNAANMKSSNNDVNIHMGMLVSLSAGGTANVIVRVSNSTKTVGVIGDITLTFFGGWLVC